MSITRKRIAITGAEVVVGTVLRRGFPSRYEVVPITRSVQPFHSLVADVTDLGALIQGFTEVHAVIHLAAAAGLNAEWNAILSGNIVGTRNVFEAARLAGVRAVVFASSGHVLGLAEERAGRSCTRSGTTVCLRSPLRWSLTRCTQHRRLLAKLWGAFIPHPLASAWCA
jgi:nucleoside-diphosphate-sugar epimerase